MTYTAQALYGMEFPQLFLWPGLIRFTEQIHSCDINLEPEYHRGLLFDYVFLSNLLSDFLSF